MGLTGNPNREFRACLQEPEPMHPTSVLPAALLLFPILLSGCGSAPAVELAADVNRDGIVDFSADEAGEDAWTPRRGALFLNNNDDDQERGEPDHADEVVNGPADLEDLAVLLFRRSDEVAPGSRIELTVDEASRSRIRLFYRTTGGDYQALGSGFPILLEPVLPASGELELRIEANSYADGSWDGQTLVSVSVSPPGAEPVRDAVRLRVAPFILLSNLNGGIELYVRESPGRNDLFVSQLAQAAEAADFGLVKFAQDSTERRLGVWFQDAMEIGYTEMPGRIMNVVLKANRNMPLDEVSRRMLLGPDYGWFTCGEYRPDLVERDRGNRWLDWYGNLEVSPPVPGYPLGRVYYGSNGDDSMNPEIIAMLDAQGVQGPAVELDTSWLVIKHVDEMVSFVPTGDPRHPHRVLVPDPEAMIRLLDQWVAEGHGDLPILEPFRREGQEPTIVASLRDDTELRAQNILLARERIAPNLETLKREFGLSDEDFIGIPSYMTMRGSALIPNVVNSVVVNGHFLAADPFGPVVDGVDLLQEAVRDLLADLPLEVIFLDDRTYHSGGGEVHCATNVRRHGYPDPWWTYVGRR
jgi:protein-arginine deiminase